MPKASTVKSSIHSLHAKERGLTEIDWLKSYPSFSFGEYYDPERMGFRALRVINEDTVLPGKEKFGPEL